MSEPRVDFEHGEGDSLIAILESAAGFGLTPDEIWEAVMETPGHLPDELRTLYVEELTRALATRLLQKERSF
jgi:hypothetical protein